VCLLNQSSPIQQVILNHRNHCLDVSGHSICYSHHSTRIGKKHQKQGTGYSKHDKRGNGSKINHETRKFPIRKNFREWCYKRRRDTIKPANERRACINYQKLKYQSES